MQNSIPDSAIERTDRWRVRLKAWRQDMRTEGRIYADEALWKPIRKDLAVPVDYRDVGQPVFIPGSMGTASYVLAGTEQAYAETWGSVCHGAGRAMSRSAARRATSMKDVLADLKEQGIAVQAGSKAGLVEEFPGAYKDVSQVVAVVAGAGLARLAAKLAPLGVVKG